MIKLSDSLKGMRALVVGSAFLTGSVSMGYAEQLKIAIIAPNADEFSDNNDIGDYFMSTWSDQFAEYANHDIEDIVAGLEGMLAGSSYAGSTVDLLNNSVTLQGINNATGYTWGDFEANNNSSFDYGGDSTPMNTAYTDWQTLQDNTYDVVVLVNDPAVLKRNPHLAFEGVLGLTDSLMEKGTKVLLFEPSYEDYIDSAHPDTLKQAVHKIANGVGINVIPADTACDNYEAAYSGSLQGVTIDRNEVTLDLIDLNAIPEQTYSYIVTGTTFENSRSYSFSDTTTDSPNYFDTYTIATVSDALFDAVDATTQWYVQDDATIGLADQVETALGEAVDAYVTANGSSSGGLTLEERGEEQTYIMAGSIFSSITGLSVDSGTSYEPEDATLKSRVSTVSTHIQNAETETESTNQYTEDTSEEGLVKIRPLDLQASPHNGELHYIITGSSTEAQMETELQRIFTERFQLPDGSPLVTGTTFASGTGQKSTIDMNGDATILDVANKDKYAFVYARQGGLIDDDIMANQSHLQMFLHSTKQHEVYAPTNRAFEAQAATPYFYFEGGQNTNYIPAGTIGRFHKHYFQWDMFWDNHHANYPGIHLYSSSLLTSAIGWDYDSQVKDLRKFKRPEDPGYIGWNTVMQQAFMAEDRRFIPDTNLQITSDSLPSASATNPLNITLAASGGTAPYTWEEVSGSLPKGIVLRPNGTLQGNALGTGGTYNLVIKVTDANGAIRKTPLSLTSVGYGLNEADYGWVNNYCYDTQDGNDFITGTLVKGYNGGNTTYTASSSTNSVTFSPINLGSGQVSSYPSGMDSTGYNNFNSVLESMSLGDENIEVVELTGLTPGDLYSLQVFYSNKVDSTGDQAQMHVQVDGSDEVILHSSFDGTSAADHGTYGICNFIASGSTVEVQVQAKSETWHLNGKAALNAMILTKPAAPILNENGVSRYAKITWSGQTEADGPQDFISGVPVAAVNGGSGDHTFNFNGATFSSHNMREEITDSSSKYYGNETFEDLVLGQTRAEYYHRMSFDGLTIGKEYTFQIFNSGNEAASQISGTDSFFGLEKHGAQQVFTDGKVMYSTGTFTATAEQQILEIYANPANPVKDIGFSAIYLVEAEEAPPLVADDGTNTPPTLTAAGGETETVVSYSSVLDNLVTTFESTDTAGDIVTYSVTGGNDNNWFYIDEVTGELFVINEMRGIVSGVVELEVTATDNRVPADSTSITHTVRFALEDNTDGDNFSDELETRYGTNYLDSAEEPFLIGYWDFNDNSNPAVATGEYGSGDINIISPAVYSDTTGGHTGANDDRAIFLGDGTNTGQRLTISDISPVTAAAQDSKLSISFWAKSTNTGKLIFQINSLSKSNHLNMMLPHSGNRIRVAYDVTKVNWAPVQTDGYFTEWRHYAYVHNGNNQKVYVDGAYHHQGSKGYLDTDISELLFGNNFEGCIDDISLYNGVLTEDQIASLASGTSPEQLADSDEDGLVDAWELAHFGNITATDGTVDSDGDGQNDLSEFISGTLPQNHSSMVEIDSISHEDDISNLKWKGKRFRTYGLQYSSDLQEWFDTGERMTVETEDEVIELEIFSDRVEKKEFYRITVE